MMRSVLGAATEGVEIDAAAVAVDAGDCPTVVVVVGEVVDEVVAGGASVVVVWVAEVTGDDAVVACAAARAGTTPNTTDPITTSGLASRRRPVRSAFGLGVIDRPLSTTGARPPGALQGVRRMQLTCRSEPGNGPADGGQGQ